MKHHEKKDIQCFRCNKNFSRPFWIYIKNKTGKFFCSVLCRRTDNIKRWSRQQTHHLIKRGILKPSKYCDHCKSSEFIQAHHNDYNNPSDIQWLCHSCHNKIHYKTRKEITERRRIIFGPCSCGRPAIVKNLCSTCYSRKRQKMMPICVVSHCSKKSHSRGLCDTHRRNKKYRIYALPRQRPGIKVK